LRSSKYLNNLIEQDHRGVKLRIGPMLGFKLFRTAAITAVYLDGYYAPRRRAGTTEREDGLYAVALILFGIATGAIPNDIEHGVVVVGGRRLS
jgi:hypothetical protein